MTRYKKQPDTLTHGSFLLFCIIILGDVLIHRVKSSWIRFQANGALFKHWNRVFDVLHMLAYLNFPAIRRFSLFHSLDHLKQTMYLQDVSRWVDAVAANAAVMKVIDPAPRRCPILELPRELTDQIADYVSHFSESRYEG